MSQSSHYRVSIFALFIKTSIPLFVIWQWCWHGVGWHGPIMPHIPRGMPCKCYCTVDRIDFSADDWLPSHVFHVPCRTLHGGKEVIINDCFFMCKILNETSFYNPCFELTFPTIRHFICALEQPRLFASRNPSLEKMWLQTSLRSEKMKCPCLKFCLVNFNQFKGSFLLL